MLTVCNKHVKTALQYFNVPHVKKINGYECLCSFCNEKATIKLYYPAPFSRKKYSIYLIENNNYYQYYKVKCNQMMVTLKNLRI
jgi:C4-type Zn-finger protein